MNIQTTAVNPIDLYPKFGGSNMKKIALLALLGLALGGAHLEAGSAAAGNDTRIDSNIDRNIIRFTATYENIIGGTFTCVGFRIHNPGSTRDTEQCIFTDLSSWPPGTYAGHPDYKVNGMFYSWFSDYDGVTASDVRFIITDNGDGTGHADVLAYSP